MIRRYLTETAIAVVFSAWFVLVTASSAIAGPNNTAIAHLGNPVYGNNSTVKLYLSGTTPGSEHDQLDVSGHLTLNGGSLDIALIGDYVPDYLDEFVVLTASTREGEFGEVNGVQINPDKTLAPVYDFNGNVGVTLVAAIPGDATLDGNVDLDDLLILLDNVGSQSNWDEGDFTGDQNVGLEDLQLLLNNAGTNVVPSMSPVAASSPSLSSIPEPSSVVVMMVMAVVLSSPGARRSTI